MYRSGSATALDVKGAEGTDFNGPDQGRVAKISVKHLGQEDIVQMQIHLGVFTGEGENTFAWWKSGSTVLLCRAPSGLPSDK